MLSKDNSHCGEGEKRMGMLSKQSSKLNPFDKFFGTISLIPWLLRITLLCLVSTMCLQLHSAATGISTPPADHPSRHNLDQRSLTVKDVKNQWFFADAVATSIWELAMYAEQLTLNSRPERVETLLGIYPSLIEIESELALMRQNLADHHGITDTLMSHSSHALTAAQQSAFDTYMLEVITWHQKAATIIEQDTFLKTYYDHLLAINGITVFLERFQDVIRSQPLRFDKRVNF
jgi:hypothetical protein